MQKVVARVKSMAYPLETCRSLWNGRQNALFGGDVETVRRCWLRKGLRPALVLRSSYYSGDEPMSPSYMSHQYHSGADAGSSSSNKVNIYTDYTIYKGKGAMTMKIIKPTWERVPSGTGIRVARSGVMLLEFASARGERDYDWENKENFALSALECADILEAVENNTEKSFFHDPNKFSTTEGSLTKQLRISPARETGWFFSLSVNHRGASPIRFDIIVSNGELRLMRSLMDFSIPRLMGFDEVFVGPPDIKQLTPSAEFPMGRDTYQTENDLPPF